MSAMATFASLGFRHIVDIEALDHILFLLALAAVYRWRDVRDALWVVTAFTVGHSITLGLAVTGVVTLPSDVIEFLIPITIVATCVENVIAARRPRGSGWRRYRPLLAGTFGLVHGAGFANYLKAMFVDRVAVPLFGFNVGIEAGQIVVLLGAAALLALADWTLDRISLPWPVLQVRIAAVSTVVFVIASTWAVERMPWR